MNTIRPVYPAGPTLFWQAVLDLAFEREYADGNAAQELSDYVTELVGDYSVEEIAEQLAVFYEGTIEVLFVEPLTAAQRRKLLADIVEYFLYDASPEDVAQELTTPEQERLFSPASSDQDLVNGWANLGNRFLPGPDGSLE